MQSQNAVPPILVTTPSGITTVSEFPRYFFNTPFSISKSVMGETGSQGGSETVGSSSVANLGSRRSVETRMISVPGGKASFPMCVTLLGILTDSRESHPLNASCPILMTLSGISIEVSALQHANASFPILVTPSGITIEVSDSHHVNV